MFIGISDPARAVAAHATAGAAASSFQQFSDAMPTSSHHHRSHIVCAINAIDAQSYITRTANIHPHRCLSIVHFRSCQLTRRSLLTFTLHFVYTLSVSCIWAALGSLAQDYTGDFPASLQPRHLAIFRRYPRFVFFPELHCSVIWTSVVFSLFLLITSVNPRSYDSTFDSTLRLCLPVASAR